MATHAATITLNETKCCAMWEIDNLSKAPTAEDALKEIQFPLMHGIKYDEYRTIRRAPLVIFTTVVNRNMADHASRRVDDYGQAFTNYLMEHRLGKVTASEPVTNPTTLNKVVL